MLVLGDRAGLRHVVDNLLGNARSHTPAGTQIAVRVHAENGSGVLEVADRWAGDDERAGRARLRALLPRRLVANTVRRSGGAGLGLSIVSAVTEALGGEVGLESSPGAGSTFRVRLRAVPPAP